MIVEVFSQEKFDRMQNFAMWILTSDWGIAKLLPSQQSQKKAILRKKLWGGSYSRADDSVDTSIIHMVLVVGCRALNSEPNLMDYLRLRNFWSICPVASILTTRTVERYMFHQIQFTYVFPWTSAIGLRSSSKLQLLYGTHSITGLICVFRYRSDLLHWRSWSGHWSMQDRPKTSYCVSKGQREITHTGIAE